MAARESVIPVDAGMEAMLDERVIVVNPEIMS